MKNRKIIGILYICTGPYSAFWKNFFISFEEKFIKECEKRYFVFSDSKKLYGEDNCDRITKYPIPQLPWPLNTLLRFHYFVDKKEELSKCDYLFFSNANMVCNEYVYIEEFFPSNINKDLFFTAHPGYVNASCIDYPYERNKKSLAYIPWNQGKHYVIGAFFGGKTNAFLEMSTILKTRIEDDLKKNIIALWHDESHINRYILNKQNINVISPSYCYPVGFELDVDKKIIGVSKKEIFNVDEFKFLQRNERSTISFISRIRNKIYRSKLYKKLKWFIAKLINEEIKEL